MKKTCLLVVLITVLLVTVSTEKNVKAGPFKKAGIWVDAGDGVRACVQHWWINHCLVDAIDHTM